MHISSNLIVVRRGYVLQKNVQVCISQNSKRHSLITWNHVSNILNIMLQNWDMNWVSLPKKILLIHGKPLKTWRILFWLRPSWTELIKERHATPLPGRMFWSRSNAYPLIFEGWPVYFCLKQLFNREVIKYVFLSPVISSGKITVYTCESFIPTKGYLWGIWGNKDALMIQDSVWESVQSKDKKKSFPSFPSK